MMHTDLNDNLFNRSMTIWNVELNIVKSREIMVLTRDDFTLTI